MDKELQELNDFYARAMELAQSWGLEPFSTDFHVVPSHKLYEVASYGLPGHFSHWSYGRDYWRQKTMYDHGYGRIYELVINANPAQAFLLDTNTLLDNLFVIAHVIGHCYLPGTKIRTITKGIQNIEDITMADAILNDKNEHSTVIPTSRDYSGYVHTLMAGGQTFTQTSGHKLLVASGPSATPEWRAVEEIKTGEYLLSKITKPTGEIANATISSIPYLGNQAKRSKGSFDIPLNIDTGELVGLYLAEGYSRDGGQCGLCFHTDEVELHARSKYLIQKYFGLETYDDIDEATHSHQIQFNSKQVSAFLKQFGRKSHKKTLGIHLLQRTNLNFLKGVLKGFLLGDGHIADRSISFATTSPHLAWEIPYIANMFGVYFNTHHRQRNNRRESWEPHVSGPHSRLLRQLLGLDKEEYIINREWSNARQFDDYMYVKITGKESTEYSGPVYCLNAENGHSFQLANGIITHNSDFFANNAHFEHTNRRIEQSVVSAAERFREYEIQFGRDVVEEFIDHVFSIKEHIDPHLRSASTPDDYEVLFDPDPYLDLFPDEQARRSKLQEEETERRANMFPIHPEKDILHFIAENAKLKPWQRDVIMTIREEMKYFLPQMQTKIMNEGWASIMHHEMMHVLDVECDPGGIDFADVHSAVLSQAPGQLNPYWLGYNLYKRIMSLEAEEAGLPEKEWLTPGLQNPGWKKCLEVRTIERDESFLRNYMDEKLCVDLDLFTYEYDATDWSWWISEKEWEKVRDNLVASKANMGFPYLEITDGNYRNNGELYITHRFDGRPLDIKWAAKTLKSVNKLWGKTCHLESYDENGASVCVHASEDGIMVEIDGIAQIYD